MIQTAIHHGGKALVLALSLSLVFAAACAPATPTATPGSTFVPPGTPASTATAVPPSSPQSTATTAPGATAPSPTVLPYSVMTATKSGVGTYLVDGAGITLYYFTNDSPGKSAATDAIIKNWPVFFALDLTVSPSLSVADFSPIRRDDGQSQTVFRNWPLYYYVNDKAPGDTSGQGVNGAWFVIDPNNFPPAGTPGASTTTAPSSTVSPAATPTGSPTPVTPSPTPASTQASTSSSADAANAASGG